MSQITRDVYVLSNKVKEPIDYVRFTNALPIVFTFRDYDIPSGATVTVFCTKPSGKAVYTAAALSGNTVTITVSDQMFIELGTTILQVKIENNGTTLVTFGWPVKVYENSTEGDIPPSQNESGFWDELQQQVDEAVENANNAADSVDQAIQETQQAIENANNAADNANEAAQQVFDQQYILTTKHTFGLSDTVEPTSEGNALVESMEGDTWQGENPSPESPQHIYGIDDTGYFDGELQQGLYGITSGEFVQSNYSISSVNKIPCNAGDNLKISYEGKTNYIIYVFYKNDGSFLSAAAKNVLNGIAEYEYTVPQDAAYFDFDIQNENRVPITPQTAGHTTVLINNKYAIKLETRGKNLFGGKVFLEKLVSLGGIEQGEGVIEINASDLSEKVIFDKFKPNTRYTVILDGYNMSAETNYANLDFVYTDGTTKAFALGGIGSVREITSFQSDEGKSIQSIRGIWRNGISVFYTDTCGVFEGLLNYDDFIPYQSSKSYIPISSPLYSGDKIVKIGSEYKVRRENGVVVFDGSEDENWKYQAGVNNRVCIELQNSDNIYTQETAKCNLFAYDTSVYNSSSDNVGFIVSGNIFYIRFGSNSEINSLSAFKTWLQSNPVTVVYKLAIPVYEDIEQKPFYDLMAADELTNVSLLGENENLVPTNVIRFPRNEDGALSTTAYAVAKKYEDAYQGMTPSGIEDRLSALETQMAALNAQTIIVE